MGLGRFFKETHDPQNVCSCAWGVEQLYQAYAEMGSDDPHRHEWKLITVNHLKPVCIHSCTQEEARSLTHFIILLKQVGVITNYKLG